MEIIFDTQLSRVDDLLTRFEAIHNFIYANDGLSTQQTLEEFTKLLFIKVTDERTNANEFYIDKEEFNRINNINENSDVIIHIHHLFDKVKGIYPDIFEPDDRIRLSNSCIAFAVNKLQNISLNESSSDIQGLAFQKFLSHHEKDSRGQFFTPEPIIDFCVKFLEPSLNETVLDPACGSGGFLHAAYSYVKKNNPSLNKSDYIGEQLFGFDINKSIVRIAKMKLILESNSNSNIHCLNSLSDIDGIYLNFKDKQKIQVDRGFDVILTNPPFGTIGKITDSNLLKGYELAHKWIKDEDKVYHKTKTLQNGQVTEILFLERCLHLLKTGGRMGIVLPNGYFENSSLGYVRRFIKENAKIISVVNLPQETFIPYGTGVKTSLLFIEKSSKRNYSVFFSQVTKPGYSGNKNGTVIYKKDNKGKLLKNSDGEKVIDEDFTEVLIDYDNTKKGLTTSKKSFLVAQNNLLDRIDYEFYSPNFNNIITNIIQGKHCKIGDVATIVKSKSKLLKEPTLTVKYVELADVNTHSFEIINHTLLSVHELPSRASYEIQTDDILTAVAGNSIGSIKHANALVTEEHNGAICTNGFRVIRNLKIDPFYFLLFLRSESFLKQVRMYRTGAAIPNISDRDFENIVIPIPENVKLEEISHSVRKFFRLKAEAYTTINRALTSM